MKKKQKRKTRIAHVGASLNEHNQENQIWHDNDIHHLDMVLKWMCDHDHDHTILFNRDDDFIDLGDGRDFLKESYRYDIVILHMVYSPIDNASSYDYDSIYRTSDLHNRRNWRMRLLGTGARYIFAFGDYQEVSGIYLGKLPGYSMNTDHDLNVYVRDE